MGEVKSGGNALKIVVIFLFIFILCLIGYIIFSKDSDLNVIEYNVEGNSLLDISKLSDYVNYDGTYASVKTIDFTLEDGEIHSVSIDMEGKVYVGHYVGRKDITNVNGVIDILGLKPDIGMMEGAKCYILTEDGRVYEYSVNDILSDKYEATLVTDVSNVKRIFSYTYASTENANSMSGIMAILENGDYVKLS